MSPKKVQAGYSTKPLAQKLGIAHDSRVLVRWAPEKYLEWLEPLPERVVFDKRLTQATDIVHLFCDQRTKLESELAKLRIAIRADAAIWVSWPKKLSRVPTDITEDVIREVALPLGLVDIKVCAVSEVWSGLKLVIRKELRAVSLLERGSP